VPLLAGSNQDEGTFFLQPTTAGKFMERSRARFGDQADAFLKLYPAGSDEEADASQLAAFRDELAFVMRVWARAQTKTGHSKAFLYYFTHEPPPPVGATSRAVSVGGHARLRSSICFPETCFRRAPGRIWIIKSPTCCRRIG
jgi:carboxylesterase type B